MGDDVSPNNGPNTNADQQIPNPVPPDIQSKAEDPPNEFEAVLKGIKNSRINVAAHDINKGDVNTTVGDVSGTLNVAYGDLVTNIVHSAQKTMRELDEERFQSERWRRKQKAEQAKATGRYEDFEAWFTGIQNAELYYYIFTSALFEWVDWGSFLEIHSTILKEVGLTDNDDEVRRIDTYAFTLPDDELANLTCVQRTPVIEEREFGECTAYVVKFQEEGWRERVLEVGRQKHSYQLLKFQNVIRSCGRQAKWDLRVTSAEAAAELARIDFGHIWHHIVRAWAMDSNPFVRAAVGHFAGYLLRNNALIGNLLGELDRWADANETEAWQLRWTSASAYKVVAEYRLDIALQGLKKLATDENSRVTEAVMYSLMSIFECGYGSEALKALSEWTRLPQHKKELLQVDIERNNLALTILILLGFADFESVPDSKSKNLFTVLAQSATGELTQSAAGILLPYVHESLPFVFEVLGAWASSDMPHAAIAVSKLIVALFNRVDSRKHTAILNTMDRWQKSKRLPALQKVGELTVPELPILPA